MSDLLTEIQGPLYLLTLNRVSKHNAFDEHLLSAMQTRLNQAIENPEIKVILLNANGKHFCAGADLNWMQKMVDYSMEDNVQDAMVLANLLSTLYHCPKPTIAVVQGCAYGGGAGLVAACDIAIAATSARFCFSEIKLGLIPAVISPYVIKAIGERQAKRLFLSAQVFEAPHALNLNLVHHVIAEESLMDHALHYAKQISQYSAQALSKCKHLIENVANKPLDDQLTLYTATAIAQQRISIEGQNGLKAFLTKGS